jgi:hypothetical protein
MPNEADDPPTTSSDAIHVDVSEMECAICLQPVEHACTAFACSSHRYCHSCTAKILHVDGTCPMCRARPLPILDILGLSSGSWRHMRTLLPLLEESDIPPAQIIAVIESWGDAGEQAALLREVRMPTAVVVRELERWEAEAAAALLSALGASLSLVVSTLESWKEKSGRAAELIDELLLQPPSSRDESAAFCDGCGMSVPAGVDLFCDGAELDFCAPCHAAMPRTGRAALHVCSGEERRLRVLWQAGKGRGEAHAAARGQSREDASGDEDEQIHTERLLTVVRSLDTWESIDEAFAFLDALDLSPLVLVEGLRTWDRQVAAFELLQRLIGDTSAHEEWRAPGTIGAGSRGWRRLSLVRRNRREAGMPQQPHAALSLQRTRVYTVPLCTPPAQPQPHHSACEKQARAAADPHAGPSSEPPAKGASFSWGLLGRRGSFGSSLGGLAGRKAGIESPLGPRGSIARKRVAPAWP